MSSTLNQTLIITFDSFHIVPVDVSTSTTSVFGVFDVSAYRLLSSAAMHLTAPQYLLGVFTASQIRESMILTTSNPELCAHSLF
ncbi:hypothetical protein Plhal703r1_c14g0070161 [Plasmopara halstedii]